MEHCGRRLVTRSADLWSDLGFEGDDVDDLFHALQRELGPLPMQDIRWDRHFEMNEPPWDLGNLTLIHNDRDFETIASHTPLQHKRLKLRSGRAA